MLSGLLRSKEYYRTQLTPLNVHNQLHSVTESAQNAAAVAAFLLLYLQLARRIHAALQAIKRKL